MWRYDSRTGRFYSPEGQQIGWGYSGRKGRYRNNPELEHVVGSGCIPRGHYLIGGPRRSVRVGPVAMDLTPVGHRAHGRTALMIHGDSKSGDASRGCIILNRPLRERIASSRERYLEVFDSLFPDEPEPAAPQPAARAASTPAQADQLVQMSDRWVAQSLPCAFLDRL